MHLPFAKNSFSLTVLFCSPDEMKHLGPICLVNIKVPFHQLKIGFCIPTQQPLEYKANSLLPPPKSTGGKECRVSHVAEPGYWMCTGVSAETGVFITLLVANQAQPEITPNGNQTSQLFESWWHLKNGVQKKLKVVLSFYFDTFCLSKDDFQVIQQKLLLDLHLLYVLFNNNFFL